jgi:hypothetical protein
MLQAGTLWETLAGPGLISIFKIGEIKHRKTETKELATINGPRAGIKTL